MTEPIDEAPAGAPRDGRGGAPHDGGDSRRLPVLAREVEPRMPGVELEAKPRARTLESAAPAPLPAPVVAAVGGFLAGVLTYVLARVLRPRRRAGALGRRELGARVRERDLEVAGRRSFLVDVHLLKR